MIEKENSALILHETDFSCDEEENEFESILTSNNEGKNDRTSKNLSNPNWKFSVQSYTLSLHFCSLFHLVEPSCGQERMLIITDTLDQILSMVIYTLQKLAEVL